MLGMKPVSGIKRRVKGQSAVVVDLALLFIIYCKRGKASFKTNVFSVKADRDIIKKIVSLEMPSLIISIMGIIQGVYLKF